MALTQVDQGLLGTYAQYTGFKNRLINSAMVIDQRNAGASVTAGATDAYTLDRWQYGASQASKFTIQQNAGSVTPPAGFTNYLGITSSSAYSVGANDFFRMSQNIEGFNVADLGWGTANAQTVTLSFLVRSSLTGTFGGAILNGSNANYSYPFTYSIPVANTWTTISVTIAGPTGGSWVSGNGNAVKVQFGLGVGTTYSGTAGSWSANLYVSATGATSVVGTNGATFYITGVQLEKGSTATSFDYRPYGTELALCQRYYRQVGVGIGAGVGSTQIAFNVDHLSMRTTPSYTATANLQFTDWYASNPASSTKTIAISANDANFGNVYNSNFTGVTNGRIYGLQPSTSAIFASAEL